MSVVFLKKKVPKRYFRLITLCEELEDMVEELEEIIRSNDALELSIALTQTSSLVMTIEQELLRLIDNPEIRKNIENEFKKIVSIMLFGTSERFKGERKIVFPLLVARNLLDWIKNTLEDVSDGKIFEISLQRRSGIWIKPVTKESVLSMR